MTNKWKTQICKERTDWCLAAFVLALTTLLLLRLISQVLVITQTHEWLLTFPTELYVVPVSSYHTLLVGNIQEYNHHYFAICAWYMYKQSGWLYCCHVIVKSLLITILLTNCMHWISYMLTIDWCGTEWFSPLPLCRISGKSLTIFTGEISLTTGQISHTDT